MKNNFFKNFSVILSVIALFSLISLTNGKNRKVTITESIVTDIFTGPQVLFTRLKKWTLKDKDFFSDVDKLRKQNDELKVENETLKKQMIDYELVTSENTALKEHLKMQSEYSEYEVVVAEVISDGTSNWEKTYLINKGKNDGIEPNMPVITSNGLVGYIETVSNNTSKIVAVIDAGNAVSCRVVRTRDAVICKGSSLLKEPGKLKIEYIPIGVELIEGDKLETSGMGGVYPKGIAVGEVSEFTIKKNPAENEAIVDTFVDFNRLETVAVIVSRER